MKQIKFRSWSTFREAWMVGWTPAIYVDRFNQKTTILQHEDNDIVYEHFTGLKDKNGIEIYEGDIVSHKRCVSGPCDYHTGEPCYPEGEYLRIGHVTITTSKGVTLNGRQSFNPDDFDVSPSTRKYNENPGCWSEFGEVIGNIHENPELLKD